MTGQGRPRTSHSCRPLRRLASRGGWLAYALWLLIPTPALAADVELRVRLAWGDGAATRWRGAISLSSGALSEPAPLGIEADESGSMWLDAGTLRIDGRSPRRYEGVDLTVTAPSEAKLLVQLGPHDGADPEALSIPVADLLNETVTLPLDEQDNRLVARRAPGDQLRVAFDRDQLVFGPGETFSFRLTPHELGLPADTRVELVCELRPARADEVLWKQELDWTAPESGSSGDASDVEVTLPADEGVYDLVITARRRSLQRLGFKQTVTERRVQLVVIDPAAAAAPETAEAPVLLEEIDPSGPRWWERLTTVPLIPGIRKGPLGSGELTPMRLDDRAYVRLSPNESLRDASWEAYLLPVKHPGRAHVLEVEFPRNQPQHLGISIVEPNAAGDVAPVGFDSGVHLGHEALAEKAGTETHRITFWPRTKTPLVLMTNHSGVRPAIYGRIRLSEHQGRLAGSPRVTDAAPTRMAAAYYDRPLWAENFGASEALDAVSGRSLKDWRTFYDGATRLLDHLKYTGRNGLVAPAWSDGCALYPSELIESTPRYDNGLFFATAQDPRRKDVLEMLFRICDRAGVSYIPMLDFSAPLVQLESLKREGGLRASGIEWTNAAGDLWTDVNPASRGQAPYYNALDDRVQQAMIAVVDELVGRYAHHPSFTGVAVQLSAHGYAQLPGAEWGFDDATLSAFTRDTGIAMHAGPASRDALLTGEHRATWLEWRSRRLAELHRRMQQTISDSRPDAKLYLTSAHLLEQSGWEQELQPRLPRNLSVEQLWLRAGISPERYVGASFPLLLRPTRVAPSESLSEQALNLELNQANDIDRRLERLPNTAAQLYHEPQTLRVYDFEKQSPFKSTYCWLVSQPTPVGAQNRRRFVHAVATLDVEAIVDGGWTPPVGQDDALRDVLAAYCALPRARFDTVPGNTQPVVARIHTHAQETYVYLVNDSPWPANVHVSLHAPPRVMMDGLAPLRQLPALDSAGNRATWTVNLDPYDLIAVKFHAPQVAITGVDATIDRQDSSELARRVSNAWMRAAQLRDAQPLAALANAGFEDPPSGDEPIPNWLQSGPSKSLRLDAGQAHGGKQSVLLATEGDAISLMSSGFESPRLGRLQVRTWLRSENPHREAPLEVVIEGLVHGEPFERRLPCGRIPADWSERQFDFDDLPLEGVEAIRVRFDLLGAGRVWMDDVSLTATGFSQAEMSELGKILQLASNRLDAGQWRDCHTLLESYWPQFIERCAPIPVRAPVNLAERPTRPPAATPAPPPKPGLLERINRLMPQFVR